MESGIPGPLSATRISAPRSETQLVSSILPESGGTASPALTKIKLRVFIRLSSFADRLAGYPLPGSINCNHEGASGIQSASMPASMLSPALDTRPENSAFTRYESLIRLSQSSRTQREPEKLFCLLVSELCKVVQFEAIDQFDEASNKIDWHLGDRCRRPDGCPELPKEETLAW